MERNVVVGRKEIRDIFGGRLDRLPSEKPGIPDPSLNLQFQPSENGHDAIAELRRLVSFEHWKPWHYRGGGIG